MLQGVADRSVFGRWDMRKETALALSTVSIAVVTALYFAKSQEGSNSRALSLPSSLEVSSGSGERPAGTGKTPGARIGPETATIDERASTDDDVFELPANEPPSVSAGGALLQPRQIPHARTARALELWNAAGVSPPPGTQAKDATFVAEAIDPVWSAGMEATILSAVSEVPELSLLTLDVECRTTTCRVQLTQQAAVPARSELSGVPDAVYEQLFMRLGYDVRISYLVAGDGLGTVVSLIYLPRQEAAKSKSETRSLDSNAAVI